MSFNRKMEFLFYCLSDIAEKEVDEVAVALKLGWIAKGLRTIEFEKQFVEYVGAKYAVE